MEFDIREGSPNNEFILCSEQEFESWKNGDCIFIKNPSNLNSLFKKVNIDIILKSNSFLLSSYLDLIPAKIALANILPNLNNKMFNNISLRMIWNIYNSLESGRSPFLINSFLKDIPLKTKKDFSHNQSLYNYIKKWNDHHIRFFSEIFSTYSILTMRPNYYDEDSLLLNIFHRKFLLNNDPFIVYCLCWTSEY